MIVACALFAWAAKSAPHPLTERSRRGLLVDAALAAIPALKRPHAVLPPYMLLVEAGAPDGLDIDIADLLMTAVAGLMDGADAPVMDALLGRGNDFWAVRHAISEGLAHRGKVIGLDISVARRRLPALREALCARIASEFPQLEIGDFGHVGDGGMHFNLVVPGERTTPAGFDERVRDAVYEIVVGAFEGSFSAEHGLGPANLRVAEAYTPQIDRALGQSLRVLFPA